MAAGIMMELDPISTFRDSRQGCLDSLWLYKWMREMKSLKQAVLLLLVFCTLLACRTKPSVPPLDAFQEMRDFITGNWEGQQKTDLHTFIRYYLEFSTSGKVYIQIYYPDQARPVQQSATYSFIDQYHLAIENERIYTEAEVRRSGEQLQVKFDFAETAVVLNRVENLQYRNVLWVFFLCVIGLAFLIFYRQFRRKNP